MSNSIYEQFQFDDQLPMLLVHLNSDDVMLPWPKFRPHSPMNLIHYIPPYWHRNLEMVYVRKGAVEFKMHNVNKVYKAGEFILINPGDIHEITNVPNSDSEVVGLVISFDYCVTMEAEFADIRFDIERTTDKYPQLINIFESMLSLKRSGDEYSHHSMRSQLDLLLYYLLKNYQDKSSSALEIQELVQTQAKHKEILNYVHLQYAENLNLEVMAKQFNMSREHFARRFKNIFGKTFLEYLFDYRIGRAFHDIISEELTIEQISLLHGFTSSKGLIQQFKKRFSTTPNEYRKQSVVTSIDNDDEDVDEKVFMYINQIP